MITYRRDEIENKHGQYIAYWSKQKGNTELEKYKNFISNQTFNEFIIKDKNGLDMTCIVDTEEGPNGFILVCFNQLGETIYQTEECFGVDQVDILETLQSYNII